MKSGLRNNLQNSCPGNNNTNYYWRWGVWKGYNSGILLRLVWL